MLDAIADKALVNSVLIILAAQGFIHEIIPVIVVLRDIVVNAIKMEAAGRGRVVAAIGSGGFYALSAGRALAKHSNLTAAEIAKEALTIAADICVYTNHNIIVEELDK